MRHAVKTCRGNVHRSLCCSSCYMYIVLLGSILVDALDYSNVFVAPNSSSCHSFFRSKRLRTDLSALQHDLTRQYRNHLLQPLPRFSPYETRSLHESRIAHNDCGVDPLDDIAPFTLSSLPASPTTLKPSENEIKNCFSVIFMRSRTWYIVEDSSLF